MRMGLLREGGLWCSLYRDAGLVKIASSTETRLRWCERLDDAALGDDGTVTAPAAHLIQFMAESHPIGELAIDLGQRHPGHRGHPRRERKIGGSARGEQGWVVIGGCRVRRTNSK